MTGQNDDAGAGMVDPYRSYPFRVIWQGRTVAGVSRVTGLTGGLPDMTRRHSGVAATLMPAHPEQTTYAAIRLEKGITHDAAFQSWASRSWDFRTRTSDLAPNPEIMPADFLCDITIQVINVAGGAELTYLVSGCWVSEFDAVPELDAAGNATAIQHMSLQNQGCTHVANPADATQQGPA